MAYNADNKCGVTYKNDIRKRSNNTLSSEAFHALDRLISEKSEDYTDSLEHSPLNRGNINNLLHHSKVYSSDTKSNDEDRIPGETKFRKLQEKWELIIGKDDVKNQSTTRTPPSPVRTFGASGKSKIPRLLTSPIKQSNNAVPSTKLIKPITGNLPLKKPTSFSTSKTITKKPVDTKTREITRRTSRVDQDTLSTTRTHMTRPSSLPYKSHGLTSNDKNVISPHRRAASTSLPRSNFTTISRKPVSKQSHK